MKEEAAPALCSTWSRMVWLQGGRLRPKEKEATAMGMARPHGPGNIWLSMTRPLIKIPAKLMVRSCRVASFRCSRVQENAPAIMARALKAKK